MNKKLLFGFMSLAALAACTNDDFESQNVVTEEKSPIQFEVINNNEVTRASMNGNKIAWSAADGDLFTLYHGGATGTTYQNATYKAEMGDGGSAVLTTPSMILPGKAIMTWPVDTAFSQTGTALQVRVPAEQTNIENYIPYVSDVIDIKAYKDGSENPAYGIGAYNTAGYARKYPIYMRPMASQLTIKADYAGTDAAFNALATGDDPINPIAVTSIELGNTDEEAQVYTTNIGLKFTARAAESDAKKRWNKAEPNNAWSDEVGFNDEAATSVRTLTAKKGCLLDGNQGCKFLILPKSVGNAKSQVVVNTIYGKVVIGDGGSYGKNVADAAWYRYISNSANATANEGTPVAVTSGEFAGKFKTPATIQVGLTQTFAAIDGNVAPATDKYVAGEKMGGAVTRYVKVLLNHIDMDGLHVTSDKQLYDAVRVWKELGLDNKEEDNHEITVYLDGDAKTGEFVISQKTIKAINDLNAAAAKEETPRSFSVKPCKDKGEKCNTIVITGGGEIAADLTFIKANGDGEDNKADIVLKAGENWKWAASTTAVKKVTVATTTGISSFINKGTFVSDATAKLQIFNNATTAVQQNIKFVNDGTWNITAGELTVQFDVTNNGTVNISQGAEYLQDIIGENATTFTNQALTVPERFFMKDPTKKDEQKTFKEKIGKVNNSGVFCVTGTSAHKGIINNYGRIEHMLATAKTYITSNQQGTGPNPNFGTEFNKTSGHENKFGLINLPWAIRESATNVSVSSTLSQGFISLTYTGATNTEELKGDIGGKVNYVIVESGIATVGELSDNIKYLEINEPGTEIHFTKSTKDADPTADPAVLAKNKFAGLMVLSPVNIEQGVNLVISEATFLAAKMYVGGTFTQDKWNGYYGNTTDNFTSMYRTY